MERWVGRVALVTGASSGIGSAVSKSLVAAGMKVYGCARNLEKLEELGTEIGSGAGACAGSFVALQCDVTEEDDVKRMFRTIKDADKGVDVCVNNAGLSHAAPLLSGSTEQWRNMLEVNVIGLSICTREAVQSMRNRKVDDGHVINICSMSGHRVIKSSNVHFYAATKHAVKALTEGVRNELRDMKSHIRISEISPGIVETEFAVRMSGEKAAQRMYSSIECLQASDIADAVVYSLAAPAHVQIHDILMRPVESAN